VISSVDVEEMEDLSGGFSWFMLKGPVVPAPMVLNFDMSLITSGPNTIALPLYGSDPIGPGTGSVGLNAVIDWGDGSPTQTATTGQNYAHTYTTGGIKTVTINGTLPTFGGVSGVDFTALVSVSSFNSTTTSLENAFLAASNLTTVPTTLPSSVTNTSYMFNGASSFNQDISSWNTANVTNMAGMFMGPSSFNQDISTWDTSNVTNMDSMFIFSGAFNQNLSPWVTGLTAQPTSFSSSANYLWEADKATKYPFLSDGTTRINT